MMWRQISSWLHGLAGRTDWREDVSAYLDGELTERDRDRVEAQLRESTEMQEYLSDLQQMRSILRRFEPEPSATPFQLTPEMLSKRKLTSLPASPNARALGWSLSTAVAAVAIFAAVMIFDAIDSPSVNFTVSSAGVEERTIPTAIVATEEVEVQAQSAAMQSASPSSDVGSDEADAEVVTVTAVRGEAAEEEAVQAQQEEQAAEYEEAADEEQEQAMQEEMQAQQQAQQAAIEAAATDPSRRALTAGQGSGSSDAESVTAEDVVQQSASDEGDWEAMQDDDSEQELTLTARSGTQGDTSSDQQTQATTSTLTQSTQMSATNSAAEAGQTQAERRSVATSVTVVESDWPLEQRPRSGTVVLASDPSWELPLQIILAAIAIGATVFWLVLNHVERRRLI